MSPRWEWLKFSPEATRFRVFFVECVQIYGKASVRSNRFWGLGQFRGGVKAAVVRLDQAISQYPP